MAVVGGCGKEGVGEGVVYYQNDDALVVIICSSTFANHFFFCDSVVSGMSCHQSIAICEQNDRDLPR